MAAIVTDVYQAICASTFEQLTKWEDPKASGVVFGVGLFFFYLLVIQEYCLITLSLTTFQFAMVGAFAASFAGKTVPPKSSGQLTEIIDSYLNPLYKSALVQLGNFFQLLNHLIRWEDKARSVKYVALSFVVGWVLAFFSLTSLAALAWIWSFGWPPVYAKNHVLIDEKVDMVQGIVLDQIRQVPQLAHHLGVDREKKAQ
eukprot:TRINITY_DN29880_c0_g1_i1.p2 TRINITY_DN29880_c0_g1~~TRINITY_DN29880_c0_g1_i1.p2  ORF type:complete len:222 (+),score=80.36 TRINITY_DN29880_c0_g1_i1:68-667(+)